MAKVRTLETSVSLTGNIEKSILKELRAVAENADAIERAAAEAAGPVGELTDKINKQEKELKKAQIQYAGYVLKNEQGSDAAKELAKKIETLSSELRSSNNVLENAERAASELADGFDDASDAADKVGDSAKTSKGGFSIMKGAIADLVSKGIQWFIGKALDAVDAIWNLAESTQEYREDIGKLETAWEAAGKSTELATDVYKSFYAVLGEEDRSVEAVNHLAKFVETEEQMADWTNIAAGVWGTFGDSLPIEGLTEAANETAKVGQVTGPLADALNWAGVNEDDFNESLEKCSSESERAALITETLTDLYDDAAQAYMENNASVMESRLATSNLTDAQAKLGATIEPIKTRFTEFKTQALEAILPYLIALAEKFLEIAEKVLPYVAIGVEKIIDALAGIIGFIKNVFTGNWSAAWQSIVDVFGKIFSTIGGIVKSPINAVIEIINGAIEEINSIGFTVPDWVPFLGGKEFSIDIPQIPLLATGGFTDGISIAGEAGTEAVISFDPAYREKNLGYWAKAGQILGATADDFVLSGGSEKTSVNLGGVTFAPVINAGGSADGGDIIRAIKAEYPEFLDLLERWYSERGDFEYA